MKDTAPFLIIPCIILVTVVSGVSNLCGYEKGIDKMKEESVRAGVAYYTNNAAGESVFKWKEAKP